MNSLPKNAEDIRKEEYEMQLYGFRVKDLFNYLKNSLDDSFNDLTEDLKKKLCERKGSKIEEISAAHRGLIKLWKRESCEFYEELKEVIKEYFEIPSHVLLPEDKVHILSYSAEDEEEIDKKLNQLTQELISIRMMKQCLEQENLSLKKAQALEKELSESGVLDSLNIDCHYCESSLPTYLKKVMKIVTATEVNSKEHN